jgi:hypothetical protein
LIDVGRVLLRGGARQPNFTGERQRAGAAMLKKEKIICPLSKGLKPKYLLV